MNSTSVGNNTGRFSSFSITTPHFSQYKAGIGVPQYLCLETPQSFNLYFVVLSPNPFASTYSAILTKASFEDIPLNSSEFVITPDPTKAFFISEASIIISFFVSLSIGLITTFIGKSYFLAKAKSLSS